MNRGGQGAFVDLAVRGERYGLHEDEQCRHHVVRQLAGDSQAQVVGAAWLMQHAVGNQAGQWVVMVGQYYALPDGRQAADGVFYLRQFHAVPPHFHLAVSPAEETGTAIGQVSAQVASAVAAVAGQPGERVGDEPGFGQRRVAPIAKGQIGAADQDFAGFTFAHQLPGRVHDQQLRIGDAFAQGHPGLFRGRVERVVRHGLRGFGGAIEINVDGIRRHGTHLLVQRRAECIAAPEQVTQLPEQLALQLRAGLDQLAQRWGEVNDADAVQRNPAGQLCRVGKAGLGRAGNAGAQRQWREYIAVNRVVAEAGQ